jgi:pimeloyl-ACP methyl ester carboxylesterase
MKSADNLFDKHRPPAAPHVTIEDYAQSLWDVVDSLDLGRVDLLGYHTGSEVAVAAAKKRPGQVGNIVLVSAPVFTADEIEMMQETYAEIPLDVDGTRFRQMWKSVISHRGPGTSLEMMAMSFAENLRAGENYEWGHRAAFEFAPRFVEIVKSLPHRIAVLKPDDDLAEFTPRIAPYLKNGEIIDCPSWGHGFLDAYTDEASRIIKSALSGS